jgi:hypothetical protein
VYAAVGVVQERSPQPITIAGPSGLTARTELVGPRQKDIMRTVELRELMLITIAVHLAALQRGTSLVEDLYPI